MSASVVSGQDGATVASPSTASPPLAEADLRQLEQGKVSEAIWACVNESYGRTVERLIAEFARVRAIDLSRDDVVVLLAEGGVPTDAEIAALKEGQADLDAWALRSSEFDRRVRHVVKRLGTDLEDETLFKDCPGVLLADEDKVLCLLNRGGVPSPVWIEPRISESTSFWEWLNEHQTAGLDHLAARLGISLDELWRRLLEAIRITSATGQEYAGLLEGRVTMSAWALAGSGYAEFVDHLAIRMALSHTLRHRLALKIRFYHWRARQLLRRNGIPTDEDVEKLKNGTISQTIWDLLHADFDASVRHLARRLDESRPTVLSRLAQASGAEREKRTIWTHWFDVVVVVLVIGVAFLIFARWDRFGVDPTRAESGGLIGLQSEASREFVQAGQAPGRPFTLAFGVAEFDTPAHAEQAKAALVDRLATAPDDPAAADFRALKDVPVDRIRDETRALAGQVEIAGVSLNGGILIVRHGRYLYVMSGVGLDADPLSELLVAARCRFNADCDAAGGLTPGVRYQTGGLWDLLPYLQHLPAGYQLGDEDARLSRFLPKVGDES